MIDTILLIIRYSVSLLFGTALSIRFGGMKRDRRNYLAVVTFLLVDFALQLCVAFSLASMQSLLKLYPFVCHLPLFLFMLLFLKISWEKSLAAILTAYLCCEFPNWISHAVVWLTSGSYGLEVAAYVVSAAAIYFLLSRFVADPLSRLFGASMQICLAQMVIPALYYFLCYITTVFTDLINTAGPQLSLTLMVLYSLLYITSSKAYETARQKQMAAQSERDFLQSQFSIADMEIKLMQQMQTMAVEYRHDMRHILRLISMHLEEGNLDAVRQVLQEQEIAIDEITPARFCKNETMNMLMSFYSAAAQKEDIAFTVEAKLEKNPPLTEIELCTLLGNALENALNACRGCEAAFIHVCLMTHQGNFLFSVDNSCGEIAFENGMPKAAGAGHGFGTRSIRSVAEAHKGQALFRAENGVFHLQLVIPLD